MCKQVQGPSESGDEGSKRTPEPVLERVSQSQSKLLRRMSSLMQVDMPPTAFRSHGSLRQRSVSGVRPLQGKSIRSGDTSDDSDREEPTVIRIDSPSALDFNTSRSSEH